MGNRRKTMTTENGQSVAPLHPIVTTRFKRESEMREPVKAFLMERGFFPAVEFCLHGCGITDIVAGSYAAREGRKIPKLWEVVAVELKLTTFSEVLRQAKRNKHHCDWSFIAMPDDRIAKMRPMTHYALRSEGIGLLSVGDSVVEVLAPERGSGLAQDRNQVKTLWRRVRHLSSW
jgi:hypothetical protein